MEAGSFVSSRMDGLCTVAREASDDDSAGYQPHADGQIAHHVPPRLAVLGAMSRCGALVAGVGSARGALRCAMRLLAGGTGAASVSRVGFARSGALGVEARAKGAEKGEGVWAGRDDAALP